MKKLIRLTSGSVITVKNPLKKAKPPEKAVVVHKDTKELSEKLSSLQIGGNLLARKKYISF